MTYPKINQKKCITSLFGINGAKELLIEEEMGGRWGSNPRPSEPQSDALTS
jgi:hypothetical protein